jgi:hypothetical protein
MRGVWAYLVRGGDIVDHHTKQMPRIGLGCRVGVLERGKGQNMVSASTGGNDEHRCSSLSIDFNILYY